MKKQIVKAFITDKGQLKNSVMGGPCVRVSLLTTEAKELTAKTASNSSVGYCLSCSMSYLKNKLFELEIHETKKGNLIITRIISGYYGD